MNSSVSSCMSCFWAYGWMRHACIQPDEGSMPQPRAAWRSAHLGTLYLHLLLWFTQTVVPKGSSCAVKQKGGGREMTNSKTLKYVFLHPLSSLPYCHSQGFAEMTTVWLVLLTYNLLLCASWQPNVNPYNKNAFVFFFIAYYFLSLLTHCLPD